MAILLIRMNGVESYAKQEQQVKQINVKRRLSMGLKAIISKRGPREEWCL